MKYGDVTIPNGTRLLLIPDAGTNDTEECNWLIEHGIDICCLDHHEAESIANENQAIIVNNQMSGKYTDKAFSGVGVVYEFLRALDDYFLCDYADDYLDVVAFGNISDVMSLLNCQTRYYIETGLKNINNKFLKALDKAQEFSTKGEITIHNVSWYWTPILNALIRIGTFEDRDLVFRAFIETDEVFPYKKRGSDVEIDEDIYTRAARLCKNYKARQDKMRDKLYEELVGKVNPDDKVAVVIADGADAGIVGLSAIKVASSISKPTIILCEHEKGILGGSGRNYNGSPVKDFKELVNSIGLFNFAQGHNAAFGVEIISDKLDAAKEALNKALENIEYDDTIEVDFILDACDIDYDFITTLDNAKWLWGTKIDEPTIVIKGIEVCPDDIAIMGKENNAIAFFAEGIKFCKFKLKEDDQLLTIATEGGEDIITINVVGTCSINEYGGKRTPQFIIEDYEMEEI